MHDIDNDGARYGLVSLAVDTTGGMPDDEVLSVFVASPDGSPVYQGVYRPWRKTQWPDAERECGLSPDAVASCPAITECAEEIQAALDSGETFIGYDLGRAVCLLRDAGVEVDRDKLVDTSASFARAMSLMDGSGRAARMPLDEAMSIVQGPWDGDVRDAPAKALATLDVQRWSDAVELEWLQQAFIRRWTIGGPSVLDARSTAVAVAAARDQTMREE